MSEELTIGEVGRLMELAPSAIRFYESERLLEPVSRRSGRRVYEESVCDRIAVIQIAQRAGFSIAEIRTLLTGFPRGATAATRWQGFVAGKRRELTEKAEELQRMLDLLDFLQGCSCPDLDACGAAARRRADSVHGS